MCENLLLEEDFNIDLSLETVADYSLLLKNLPKGASEKEIEQFINSTFFNGEKMVEKVSKAYDTREYERLTKSLEAASKRMRKFEVLAESKKSREYSQDIKELKVEIGALKKTIANVDRQIQAETDEKFLGEAFVSFKYMKGADAIFNRSSHDYFTYIFLHCCKRKLREKYTEGTSSLSRLGIDRGKGRRTDRRDMGQPGHILRREAADEGLYNTWVIINSRSQLRHHHRTQAARCTPPLPSYSSRTSIRRLCRGTEPMWRACWWAPGCWSSEVSPSAYLSVSLSLTICSRQSLGTSRDWSVTPARLSSTPLSFGRVSSYSTLT